MNRYTTVHARYEIRLASDDSILLETDSRKADAERVAARYARDERAAVIVVDTMAHAGRPTRWTVNPPLAAPGVR